MNFVFVDEEEELDEDETLDLSDLKIPKEKDKDSRVSRQKRLGTDKTHGRLPKKKSRDTAFDFEDKIPRPRSITDKDVQAKARQGRRSSLNSASYEKKREAGWSLYCSHKKHLPTLCEREMDADKISCTCSCHEARGYIYQQLEYVPGSDDEEIISLFD